MAEMDEQKKIGFRKQFILISLRDKLILNGYPILTGRIMHRKASISL